MADRRQVSRIPKRRTFWTGAQSSATVILATPQNVQIVVTEAALENVPNPTLVRTRGMITLRGLLSADQSSIICGVGLAVLGAKEVAVGTTAVPLPLTNSDDDRWFWYHAVGLQSAPSGITDMIHSQFVNVDSKAMRKVGSNEVVALVIELADVSAGVGVQVISTLRYLFKR